ncbi:MAG: hypothetical protein IJW28_03695 [Clostridia bacterium]|nr:hypothetical protein [Clostridia bacterium]
MELLKIIITKVVSQEESVIDFKKATFTKFGVDYNLDQEAMEKTTRALENVCIKEPDGVVKYTITFCYENDVKKRYMVDPIYTQAIESVERKLKSLNI